MPPRVVHRLWLSLRPPLADPAGLPQLPVLCDVGHRGTVMGPLGLGPGPVPCQYLNQAPRQELEKET